MATGYENTGHRHARGVSTRNNPARNSYFGIILNSEEIEPIRNSNKRPSISVHEKDAASKQPSSSTHIHKIENTNKEPSSSTRKKKAANEQLSQAGSARKEDTAKTDAATIEAAKIEAANTLQDLFNDRRGGSVSTRANPTPSSTASTSVSTAKNPTLPVEQNCSTSKTSLDSGVSDEQALTNDQQYELSQDELNDNDKNLGLMMANSLKPRTNSSLAHASSADLLCQNPSGTTSQRKYPHGQNETMLEEQFQQELKTVKEIRTRTDPDACAFVYIIRDLCGEEVAEKYRTLAPTRSRDGKGTDPVHSTSSKDSDKYQCPTCPSVYSYFWDQPPTLVQIYDDIMRAVVTNFFGRNKNNTKILIRRTNIDRTDYQRAAFRKQFYPAFVFKMTRMQLIHMYLDHEMAEYNNPVLIFGLKKKCKDFLDEAKKQRVGIAMPYEKVEDEYRFIGEVSKLEQEQEERVKASDESDESEGGTPLWVLDIVEKFYCQQNPIEGKNAAYCKSCRKKTATMEFSKKCKSSAHLKEAVLEGFALIDYLEELYRRDVFVDIIKPVPVLMTPATVGRQAGEKETREYYPRFGEEVMRRLRLNVVDPSQRSQKKTEEAHKPSKKKTWKKIYNDRKFKTLESIIALDQELAQKAIQENGQQSTSSKKRKRAEESEEIQTAPKSKAQKVKRHPSQGPRQPPAANPIAKRGKQRAVAPP